MTPLVQGASPWEHLDALCLHVRVLRTSLQLASDRFRVEKSDLALPQRKSLETVWSKLVGNMCDVSVNNLDSRPHGKLLHRCHDVDEDISSHCNAGWSLLTRSCP